jgi:hypothetical protein
MAEILDRFPRAIAVGARLLASVSALVVGAVCIGPAPARATARGASLPRAICSAVIDRQASGRESGYRVILGSVSVPPAFQRQVLPDHSSAPWRYFQKTGFVIRSGSAPVIVSVPKAWRTRVAIEWRGTGPVSQIRFDGCSRAGMLWNVWAGGFRLRSPSACVPLHFQTGRRMATVSFGVGQHCR